MTEAEQSQPLATEHILVALDTSPNSTAALMAAAELAAALHMELRGLFVEDINLLHLCGLPFGLEIGSFTAKPRRLEQAQLERDFRIQATVLRKTMADIAGQQRVSWSFKVVRGVVTQEVLNAGSSAHMVSLGRIGRTPGKKIGSTAQALVRNTRRPVIVQMRKPLEGPFLAAYIGDESSEHTLQFAIQLALSRKGRLDVMLLNQSDEKRAEITQQLAESDIESNVYSARSSSAITGVFGQFTLGTVLLPATAAEWLDEMETNVIVVP